MAGGSDMYKAAGVDVEAGYNGVKLMRRHVERTKIPGVMSDIGGFGGLFSLENYKNYQEPVLISGTDGVGTKIRIAQLMNKHDTVGIDCVAMCVNDIVCSGAKPIFFLDYIAIGKNTPEKVASLVSGVAEGCVRAGCALIGGETAEHPGVMVADDYDLAGFAVGIAERSKIIDYNRVNPGDVVIALPSSGLHSNGFSLVRKVFDVEKVGVLEQYYPDLKCSLGEELLKPTAIYVKPVLKCLEAGLKINGLSHITGGGFYENIPRCLPDGLTAKLNKNLIQTPVIFDILRKTGKNIYTDDMFHVFNMGVGMILITAREYADKMTDVLFQEDCKAYIIGEIVKGDEGVILC